MKTKCLIIAKYDFTNKQGKEVKTTKAIVSLGLYGFVTLNSELLNDYKIFQEVPIVLDVTDNKFKIVKVG